MWHALPLICNTFSCLPKVYRAPLESGGLPKVGLEQNQRLISDALIASASTSTAAPGFALPVHTK